MRRRLLLILLLFAAVASLGFSWPLGASTLTARTQQLWFDRYVDAEWFGDLAQEAIVTGNRATLLDEAQRYRELYSDKVLVVDAGGAEITNTGVDAEHSAVTTLLTAARGNRHAVQPPPRLRPWDPDTMLIARPVGTGMRISGAVLLEVSTVRAKRDITDRIALITAGSWTALALFAGLALLLSRWVLNPLARLSNSVAGLTATLPEPRALDDVPPRYGGPPEVRELAHSVEVMVRAVGDAADAQRRLVADTAHAIRNPLTALAVRLESLGRVIPEQGQQSFARAGAQVERLKAILDGLLKLAVAEAPVGFGAGQLDAEWPNHCAAARVVLDRVDTWRPAFTDAEMTVAVDVPVNVADEIAAEEGVLVQILDVLLSNASRYAGAGAHTEVRLSVDQRWATISVYDNGIGVEPAELGKLTTRFFRGATAAAGGTGLGLPIAAALTQQHLGEFIVSAAYPHGLHVTVRLPVLQP
ncbi:HAMP domain-containing sensor histidine kinase [Nocardia sp. NPDC051832]|uniref:sensor histidine kinase n=1 Tax=Nocardia sp. NPDC051832 TaxID=3155673 RepID=UPI00341349BE